MMQRIVTAAAVAVGALLIERGLVLGYDYIARLRLLKAMRGLKIS